MAWQARSPDPNYDFFADFHHDGIISIRDLAMIGLNWLKTGKVKAGFFRWATDNRTTTFDYIASVWPDWWWTEKNMTYGYSNWSNESLQCSLRIKNITDIDNISYIDFRIYNTTTDILAIEWDAGDPIPNDWTPFTVAAQSRYSIYLYIEYTSYAPTWLSRITFETRVDSL